jgi:polysaccharide biosynthesis transport protein
MSNEIQLALTPNLPAQPGPWQQGGALGAPAAQAEGTPLQKVHRLLRGRYLLAVVLGLMGAAAGAAGGFLSQKPAYRSDGLIEIDPRVPRREELDKVMVMAGAYIQSTMAKLKSETVVKAAMRDPRWLQVRPQDKADNARAVANFNTNLTVAVPPKSQNFIQISWSDNAPDASKVAPVAVACVLDAYKRNFSSQDLKDIDERIEYWRKQRSIYEQQIELKRTAINNTATQHEDNPEVIRAHSQELIALQKSLRDEQENLKRAEKDLQQSEAGKLVFTPEDWARVDETMKTHVNMRNELQLRVDSLVSQLGPAHPAVLRAKEDLDARQRYMDGYAQLLNAKFVIRWKEDGTGGALIPRDLTAFRESVARLSKLYDDESKKVDEMRSASHQIETWREEIGTAKANLQQANDQLQEFEFQKEFLGPGRLKVISTGDLAVLDKDKRPMFAALGFMGGAGLPIGLLLLVGLLDSRYRYSDETAAPTSGLTLLGILPNLPDRLSDPEQAAIAAHCVHQIRTMLQINSGMEDRRVFAVTSASPGDGKTSLTLALGLSYAACGTRTLLIDCDLIGAGLTSRMNISTAEGVLEAIANRSLLPYVQQTDVADVALLPVGSAGNLHASTLSPQALRRLIDEATKHFDTILIDTGPILGSIEASLVAAAADAVILTVSRGQQRPMVEKSLGHLVAIGARLAGVVFNRAQSSDFERSISGVSMRSVGVHGPRGAAGGNGNRFGPVARAVARPDTFANQ